MSVPLSIVAAGLHIANATGFILLAPGEALADYISGAVLMSLFSWTAIWVLPSVYEYRADAMDDMRSLQAMIAMSGCAVVLGTHPNLVGVLLSVVMLVEIAMFLPSLMLIQSRTGTLIRVDFCRAMLNTCALLLTIFVFDGQPAAYVAGLLVSLVLVSSVLWVRRIHRAPFPAPRLGMRLFADGLRAAFGSLSFRQQLGARLIEVVTTLALNAAGALGIILALKSGNVAVQAAGFNGRRLSLAQAIMLGVALYTVGIGGILLINTLFAQYAPASLRLIGLREAAIAFPPFLAMLTLTVMSIKVKSVDPPSR